MAPLQFGILMVPYQVIDVAGPLDILSSCSTAYMARLEAAGFPGTAGMTEKAIDIQFHHINETLDPVTLTAGIRALPTTTCDDCPPLDFLLIGGPDPFTYQLSDRFAEFLRAHVEAGKGIFATCTGPLAISPSGVLDGKNATTNHAALEIAKKMSPNVKCRCRGAQNFLFEPVSREVAPEMFHGILLSRLYEREITDSIVT